MVERSEPINTELTLFKLLTKFGGFQSPTIKNISLRFFVNNKAELLEYNTISQLLDMESKADFLHEKIDS